MSKHTPGPWYAVSAKQSDSTRQGTLTAQWDDTMDPGKETVWTVSSSPTEAGWEHDSGCPGYGVSEENARLMAAAPELAQVTAWMLGILESPLPRAGSHEADDRRQETELACAAARLALAKAEGVEDAGEQVRAQRA